MSGRVLFLSDIHLRPGAPGRHRRFLDFLRSAKGADHVYLLGDLFDYWIGPRHLQSEDYREVLDGLREITRGGLPLSFLPGNRDYLVDAGFARATGVRLAGDEVEIELGGRRVHLSHGDFLYNRNPRYSAYRRMMRLGPVRAAFLMLPAALETRIARGFRVVSVQTTSFAPWSRSELVAGAERHFRRGFGVVICGHIHQPCHIHDGGRDLFVAGDWGGGGEYVEFDGSAFRLRRAPAEGEE